MHRILTLAAAFLFSASCASGAPVRTVEELDVVLLPKPVFEGAGTAEKGGPFTFAQVSARPNQITDVDA
ncbi:MAG TPA: hypothetical protein VF414_08935, partial [Thermoanaerobaculia bacterium]